MSLARIAAAAAILSALSVADAAAKSATVSAEVNLRKGAGTDTDVLTLVPKGSKVEVGKCTNGWCEVTFDGQVGYAIAKNLGLGAPRPVRRLVGTEYEPAYGPGRVYMVGPPPPYYDDYYGPYWGPRWGWRGGWRRW